MTLSIRKAQKKDFINIWSLLKQLFTENNLSKVKTQEIFFNTLKDKESIELVLELKNQTIGYASIKLRKDI